MQSNSVLVIQTAYLGDSLLCLPLLRAVRKKYSDARLTFACRKGFGEFYRELGVCDEVIEIDKSSFRAQIDSFKKLRATRACVIFAPQRSFRTALWVKLLWPKQSFGFRSWWNFLFFTDRVEWIKSNHDVIRQLSLIEGNIDPSSVSLKIALPPSTQFSHYRGYVALIPGSQWPTKRWTESGFTELAQKLIERGEKILVLGSPAELDIANRIAALVPHAINLCGKTALMELALILRECKFVASNDSGPMHMACLSNTPIVAIFGPTTLDLGYAPWSPNARVVETSLKCRPCGKHGHNKCPLGTHDCMKNISAAMVLDHAPPYGKIYSRATPPTL